MDFVDFFFFLCVGFLDFLAADLCIGVYLLCIGERDQRFRGEYNQHGHEWMTSWQCTCLRLLAVTTSEVMNEMTLMIIIIISFSD